MGVGAVVAGAIAVIGAGVGVAEQQKAAGQQRAANRRAARIEAVQAQQQRVAAIRQQRIQAGQVVAQAGSEGTLGSSAVQGGLGSLASRTAANIGVANQIDGLQQARINNLSRASRYESYGAIATTVGNTALQYGVNSYVNSRTTNQVGLSNRDIILNDLPGQ